MGIDLISEYMSEFGFGQRTGIDLGGERTGVLPSREWKAKAFRKPEAKRWYSGETISVSIGQGYNNFTPLQVAHATGVLVSGGKVATPRLVTGFQDAVSGEITEKPLEDFHVLKLPDQHVSLVKEAMYQVTQEGTARLAFQGALFPAGGKTGTAQVFSLKQGETYDKDEVQDRLKDHSWFIAFSPVEKPEIALAVIVENGGFGSQAAAPVARYVLDTYWGQKGLLGPAPSAYLQKLRKARREQIR